MTHVSYQVQRWASRLVFLMLLAGMSIGTPNAIAAAQKPLKALFLSGGGYHDYEKLVPHLTTNISQLANVTFDVSFDLNLLKNEKFADAYDVVVYDVCFDEVDSSLLENALKATRNGKPTVMIHCAVHAFRHSDKVREWENCCGMRSKVHDPFHGFATEKVNKTHPLLQNFPDHWETPGDELYQTIEMIEGAQPLLKVKSPHDGREHIVCWTHNYGRGHVCATTLGHDMKTAQSPDYLRLLASGILWTCDKLDKDGKPADGFGAPK